MKTFRKTFGEHFLMQAVAHPFFIGLPLLATVAAFVMSVIDFFRGEGAQGMIVCAGIIFGLFLLVLGMALYTSITDWREYNGNMRKFKQRYTQLNMALGEDPELHLELLEGIDKYTLEDAIRCQRQADHLFEKLQRLERKASSDFYDSLVLSHELWTSATYMEMSLRGLDSAGLAQA